MVIDYDPIYTYVQIEIEKKNEEISLGDEILFYEIFIMSMSIMIRK